MEITNKKLYWSKDSKENNIYHLRSLDENLAILFFENTKSTNARIEFNNNILTLEKTGFPNPTTISIKNGNSVISQLVQVNQDGKFILGNKELDWMFFSTGDLKIKINGISGETLLHFKPIQKDNESKLLVETNLNEIFSEIEKMTLIILGFYLTAIQFKEKSFTELLSIGVIDILSILFIGML